MMHTMYCAFQQMRFVAALRHAQVLYFSVTNDALIKHGPAPPKLLAYFLLDVAVPI